MIAFVKGHLALKSPTQVIIETGGIGYEINISLNTFSAIGDQSDVQLHTILLVKEDSHTLYGFWTLEEKQMFSFLISVSGVGPNTARVILSSLQPQDVSNHILSGNVAAFNAVKGIGPKTAKRIILDLQDKLTKKGLVATSSATETSLQIHEEAISALMALGFPRPSISKALKTVASNGTAKNVEEVIKEALKLLS